MDSNKKNNIYAEKESKPDEIRQNREQEQS